MFQGQKESIKVPAPFKGMDLTQQNNLHYARYIQNMLVSENNTMQVRHGTGHAYQFTFDASRPFRDIISVMSYFRDDGKSDILIYQNYLEKLEIGINEQLFMEASPDDINKTRISIWTNGLPEEVITLLKQRIINDAYVFVSQESLSEGRYIEDVRFDDNSGRLAFDIDFPTEFFDHTVEAEPDLEKWTFSLWYELGAIYKIPPVSLYQDPTKANRIDLLKDGLDANVIISSIFYQDKLLIANGVDPVFTYDGNTIEELLGEATILINTDIQQNNQTLTFSINEFFQDELKKYLKVGDLAILVNENERQEIAVTSIAYEAPVDSKVAVTLTLAQNPPAKIKHILYKKNLPHFNFLTVANDRLWALSEGRSYHNKFRPKSLAMKAYYCPKRKSIDGWFDAETNELAFIDMAATSTIPDNLEAIIPFQGKVLFVGRETTQVWSGEDPTTINDGNNITLPEFRWEKTENIGILQKSLYVVVPNSIVFWSKFGISSFEWSDRARTVQVNYVLSSGIDQHLKEQLTFVNSDQEYRNLQAFLYPYGRFLGFKMKYSCIIHQLKHNSWSIFSENFADCSSFHYDPISQNLFLGASKGKLLVYTDKVENAAYIEEGKGALLWNIHYNWMDLPTTWNNTDIFIACRTLKPTEVNVRLYIDSNDSNYLEEIINIEQEGGLYDAARFNDVPYAYRGSNLPYEMVRVSFDSVMLSISGSAEDQFIFDKLILTGGTNGN